MKELQDLRNEVLNLRNMGELTKQTESLLLNKLNSLEQQLRLYGVVFNEAEDCPKCLKPKRMKPNTIQMLCECVNSEVELCRYTTCDEKEYMYGLCKNHLCQQWS